MPREHRNDDNGSGSLSVDLKQDMAAFDKLPRALRDFLNFEALFDYACERLLRKLRDGASAKAMIASLRESDADLREEGE